MCVTFKVRTVEGGHPELAAASVEENVEGLRWRGSDVDYTVVCGKTLLGKDLLMKRDFFVFQKRGQQRVEHYFLKELQMLQVFAFVLGGADVQIDG